MNPPADHGFLRTFLERSPDGLLLVSAAGTVEYANPAARLMLAAEADVLQGSPVSRWVPELEVRADRPVAGAETKAFTATEDGFAAELSVTPVEDDGRSLVTLRDVSRRKALEATARRYASELETLVETRTNELDDLRKRCRALYDLAPVLDFDLDSQSSIASANRKACLSLGVPIDRLVGLPLADLARPEARDELIASLEKVRDGSLAPFEAKLRSGDGSTIDVVFHACRGDARSSVRLVGLDVTARREAERLVDQSLDLAEAQRARMERILRGIGEGVIVTDPDGQVRLMNSAAERFLTIEERFAFGRDLFSEQRDIEFVRAWRQFTSGSEEPLSKELTTAGSNPRSFAVTITRIKTPEGRPAGCVAVMRDVTSGRRVDRMKREFVSNVTHELRTPLASIRGFTTTILRSEHIEEADMRRFLGIVEHEAERLQRIIEDLLELAHLEEGQEIVRPRPSNLVDVLQDARALFAPAAKERGVTVDVHTEGQNGNGTFDPEKMRRVLDNLITNALKYTSSGGRVDIELRREGDRLECAVRDTGKGIPSEVLEHIFDRHFTANPVPGNPWGTGLGLHIARRLVELHGGEIAADSRPGEGSTFRFRIPAVPPSALARAPEDSNARRDDPLVDDPGPVEASGLSWSADST